MDSKKFLKLQRLNKRQLVAMFGVLLHDYAKAQVYNSMNCGFIVPRDSDSPEFATYVADTEEKRFDELLKDVAL